MSVLIPAIGRSLGPAIRSIFSLSDAAPTYYWDFRPGRLDANMSFTRASSGWYFNSSGVLVSASSNVARFDYDPAMLSPLGYLAEMQSTNGVVFSQALTQTGWTATAVAITNNAVVSPDGTTNASTLKEDATLNVHLVAYNTVSVTAASVYGFSAYVKNVNGSRWFQLNISGSSFFNFQPSTGTLGSVSAGVSGVYVRNVGNGWWRISGLYTATATVNTSVRCYMAQTASDSGGPSYTGDNTSTIAVWGVQFETAGVGVTSYIPTAGSTVTRAADLLTLPLTSLPGWNASKGGVLVAAYRLNTLNPATPGFDQPVASFDDGTLSNLISFLPDFGGGGAERLRVVAGGVTQWDVGTSASPAVFARRKSAAGWSVARALIALDGALDGGSGTGSVLLPTGLTTFHVGAEAFGDRQLNGAIESIAYYAGARSDAFVQGVSR